MITENVIDIENLSKKYKGFEVDIPELHIPKGFATALIGENGAGKSTLLNILSGIRLDYKGEITFFQKWSDKDREKVDNPVKEMIGYIGPNSYFLPNWNVKQVRGISQMLFEKFDPQKFDCYCENLGITSDLSGGKFKKISSLSDGMKMKLMLATIFARETEMLLLDEPASPLDPLMRDKLCDMIQEYIENGNGDKSVLFSTHNISDMENVTDYAIIMEHGNIVEKGFVEELKEKYVVVKGEAQDIPVAKNILYTITTNHYGYEGICLAKRVDELAGLDITLEEPSLSQISVAVMKKNTNMKLA